MTNINKKAQETQNKKRKYQQQPKGNDRKIKKARKEPESK